MKINNYQNFLILEKFDDNIIKELKRLGIKDEKEINTHLYHAHRGNLAEYLRQKGRKFTFGMLRALFEDALDAKRKTELRVGGFKMVHRLVPILMAPFFPILAVVGYILGTSRAFNKIIAPILSDPGNDYPAFLKKIIDATMKVAEGDLTAPKDRFTRAFVVSDRLVEAIKPEVLQKFSMYISDKMSKMDQDSEVPDHYIENELKTYLNNTFDINPLIPMKEAMSQAKYAKMVDSYKKDVEDIMDIYFDFFDEFEYEKSKSPSYSEIVTRHDLYGDTFEIGRNYAYDANCIMIRIHLHHMKVNKSKNFDGLKNSRMKEILEDAHKRVINHLQPVDVLVGSMGDDLDIIYFFDKPKFERYNGCDIYGSNFEVNIPDIGRLSVNSRHFNIIDVDSKFGSNNVCLIASYDSEYYYLPNCIFDHIIMYKYNGTPIERWIEDEWVKACRKFKIRKNTKSLGTKVNWENKQILPAEFMVWLKDNVENFKNYN